jgi:hypothetical protein
MDELPVLDITGVSENTRGGILDLVIIYAVGIRGKPWILLHRLPATMKPVQ